MELRVRARDLQWTALCLFALYIIVVVCFIVNEIEKEKEDELYQNQVRMVWNTKERSDFYLSHEDTENQLMRDSNLVAKLGGLGSRIGPKWQQYLGGPLLERSGRKYFLAAMVQPQSGVNGRGFDWHVSSLKQWLHFVLMAGVQHVYVCDSYEQKEESLKKYIEKFIKYKLVTYIGVQYNNSAGVSLQKAHALCSNNLTWVINRDVQWLLIVSSLEFPFVTNDQEEGFLTRHIERLTGPTTRSIYTDITANNIAMTGQENTAETLVMGRWEHYDVNQPPQLTAPLYRPSTRVHGPELKTAPVKAVANTIVSVHSQQLNILNYCNAASSDSEFKVSDKHRIYSVIKDTFLPLLIQSIRNFGDTDCFFSV